MAVAIGRRGSRVCAMHGPFSSAGMERREFLLKLAALSAAAGIGADGGRAENAETEAGGSDALGPVLPKRALGRTGAEVTMLGLGGFHVGCVDEQAGRDLIEAAIAEGIRFFDTAESYQNGWSETVYGRHLTPKYRGHIFLMTKTMARDRRTAERDLEGSLKRLNTDHVDLWQVHSVESARDADHRQAAGVFEAMAAAKASGKARFVGFTGHRLPEAHLRVLELTGMFEACQMPVNVADPGYRSFLGQVLPKLVEAKTAVLAMKTLAYGGFFGRNLWHRRKTGVEPLIPNRITVEDAMRFVWSLPVATLITGPDDVEQLREKAELARSFKPMDEEGRTRLHAKVADLSCQQVEYYKA